MYLIRWVRGGHFPRGFYQSTLIPVESYLRGMGAGQTISKRTPRSLDREDHQDFVICCRTYSNPNSSDLDREGFVSTDTRYIHIDSRSVMELLME